MRNQAEKAAAFRALYEREGAFIIPNPWDLGTARILAHPGFEALATTSAGYAFSSAAQEMCEHGTFTFAADAVSSRDVSAIFDAWSGKSS